MLKIKHFLRRRANNWPVIIGLIILALGLIFVLWYHRVFSSKTPTIIPEETPVVSITEDYASEAQAALTDYQLFLRSEKSIADIKLQRDHLLSLTITRQYQSLHLSLVMIADALIAGEEGESAERSRAEALLTQVLTEHPEFKI